MSKKHEKFMLLALAEAAKGLGRTAPNPAVGAVLVKGNQVIATGSHAKAGGPHAEVVALRQAESRAKNATLYISLEPCSHHGKTPPCVEAVLAAQVKRVVLGAQDPNPLVNGQGIRHLRRAGVEVVTGILKQECEAFYRPFQTFVTQGRPFVTLKTAMTLDGMVATSSGESQWITGPKAREHVHLVRNQVDGILVGRGTIEQDNPRLTTRLPGKQKGHNPVRIILDSQLRMSPHANVLTEQDKAPTWIMATSEASRMRERNLNPLATHIFRCRENSIGQVDLKDALKKIAAQGLIHVLVEGGPTIHSTFLNCGLADRLLVYISPKLLGGKGLPAFASLKIPHLKDAISFKNWHLECVGEDLLLAAEL